MLGLWLRLPVPPEEPCVEAKDAWRRAVAAECRRVMLRREELGNVAGAGRVVLLIAARGSRRSASKLTGDVTGALYGVAFASEDQVVGVQLGAPDRLVDGRGGIASIGSPGLDVSLVYLDLGNTQDHDAVGDYPLSWAADRF